MMKVVFRVLGLASLAIGAPFDDQGLRGGLSGLRWSDWDGRQTCAPLDFSLPESEAEVVQIVRLAAARGERVKVIGAGHSFSAIALSEGARYVSLDRMRAPVAVRKAYSRDDDAALVTVQAGMRLFELNAHLEEHDLALENLGATAEQSIAGAIATGTHGTGLGLGSISVQVEGLRLVTGTGEVREVTRASEGGLLDAARVSLGALGIVTEVTLRAVPMFRLRLQTISVDVDVLLERLDDLLHRHKRVQWFFFPYADDKKATLLIRTRTEDAISPGGCWEPQHGGKPRPHEESGGLIVSECVDVAYKAMTGSRAAYKRRTLYTEMEMFVPAEVHLAATRDARALFKAAAPAHDAAAQVFFGVRYVAADSIWLSPQHNRSTAVLSVIVQGSHTETGNPAEFDRLSQAVETMTAARHQAVPHWGKKNFATRTSLAPVYGDRLAAFERLRARLDPKGLFLNPYLEQRLGPAPGGTVAMAMADE